jgi:nucleoside-diphosphate-sugar epimerase
VKKIIVTGSCGFIGFNLINQLDKNIQIIGIDSLNDAYDSRFKQLRQKKLEKLENFKFYQIDLSNYDSLNKNSHIFENCDAVVHLGARAGVRQSFLDPEKYLMDNTLGTTNLSLKVKDYQIPQILIASTSSIYGDTGKKLAVENKDELFNPPSVYASTKSFGETLAKNILEDTSTLIKISRFFTVYGPFGRPDMSILRFIHWIASGQDVIIYGNGNQRRSFTYVSDIVDGVQGLLKYREAGTFNFGSNQTWSLNEVIELIEKELGKKGKVENKVRAYKDVDVVLPSLELSKEILNWEPKINIQDGIKRTVEWYLEYESTIEDLNFKYEYE